MSKKPKLTQLIVNLASRFPAAFFVRGVQRRPLKIGIHHDIRAAAPDIDATLLKRALARYVNADEYLHKITEGIARIDLAGEPAGLVTLEEAEWAQAQFKARQAAHKAKKSAKPAAPAAPDAKERRQAAGGDQKSAKAKSVVTKSSRPIERAKVADQLAAAAHVGGGTMRQALPAKRLSLDDLRAAARGRKAVACG